jgi:polyphosphate glucokinase
VAGKDQKRTLAVDIGGSGIKALILGEDGKPLTKRSRTKTPKSATPEAVLEIIVKLAEKQGDFDRVSVGFPGVVRNGVTETAYNLDSAWRGFHLADALVERLGKPSRVANDADVQGLGVVSGQGVELVITLGTGLGSALFLNGRLVPNLEVAHHPFRKGKTYEDELGQPALKKTGKKKWNRTLRRAIRELEKLFNYDCLYIGGGNTKKININLPASVKVVPNIAGLLGGIALWRD